MRYYPKARTKTVIMSLALETKPKKFSCTKILSSVELKRQKTFLPSNIINILIDLSKAYFHYFHCKHKVRFYILNIDYLDKIVLVFFTLYHIVIL
jgi:hypothetical protein